MPPLIPLLIVLGTTLATAAPAVGAAAAGASATAALSAVVGVSAAAATTATAVAGATVIGLGVAGTALTAAQAFSKPKVEDKGGGISAAAAHARQREIDSNRRAFGSSATRIVRQGALGPSAAIGPTLLGPA